MNCWFKVIEYADIKFLSDELNRISAERGIQDVSVIDVECDIGEEYIYRAMVKITGTKPLGYNIDEDDKCRVTT